jgi:hypothetical protein
MTPSPEQIAVKRWQERIRENHPNSEPQFWRDEIIAKYARQECDDLRALVSNQATEIAELKDNLQFVERWAVHHGTKPHVTAEQALSLIQHYPPIRAITKSYVDGKVPDTFDPYAQIAELKAKLAEVMPLAKFGAMVMRDFSALTVTKINKHALSQDLIGNGSEVKPSIEATITKLLKN